MKIIPLMCSLFLLSSFSMQAFLPAIDTVKAQRVSFFKDQLIKGEQSQIRRRYGTYALIGAMLVGGSILMIANKPQQSVTSSDASTPVLSTDQLYAKLEQFLAYQNGAQTWAVTIKEWIKNVGKLSFYSVAPFLISPWLVKANTKIDTSANYLTGDFCARWRTTTGDHIDYLIQEMAYELSPDREPIAQRSITQKEVLAHTWQRLVNEIERLLAYIAYKNEHTSESAVTGPSQAYATLLAQTVDMFAQVLEKELTNPTAHNTASLNTYWGHFKDNVSHIIQSIEVFEQQTDEHAV